MISRIFKYIEKLRNENQCNQELKSTTTQHALRDIVRHKKGKELEKLLSDLIIFAEGYNNLKKSGDITYTESHQRITFKPNNTFIIENYNLSNP